MLQQQQNKAEYIPGSLCARISDLLVKFLLIKKFYFRKKSFI